MAQPKVVIITGASSGFGRLTAETLARAGHTVLAGMRDISGRNSSSAAALAAVAAGEGLSLEAVEMDVQHQESVDAAIGRTIEQQGRIDVLVHNAGHLAIGPAEAFTPDQLAEIYDINVLGTQRVNRAVLPHLRSQKSGYVIWVGSTSSRGGHPPFLAPYFAAKAAMDALAESYASEVIRFGVGTTIVVPGAFTTGTNHFAHASGPADTLREAEYNTEYGELRTQLTGRLTEITPADADVQEVADEIARLVTLPAKQRPFRTHVDPSRDGSEVVSAVADRIRSEFYRRIGIEDLLPENASL